MNRLYIILELAGQRVAIRAEHVDAVVDVDAIAPAPLAARHIAGIAALRSRVITIIDARAALGEPSTLGDRATRHRSVVVQIDGHGYGLIVDSVEDVLDIAGEPEPINADLGGEWKRLALGVLRAGDDDVLLIDPERLIEGPRLPLAA